MTCQHCGSPLRDCLLDLGSAPFSNAYLSEAALRRPEAWYPLRVMVCSTCWLVQTQDAIGADAVFDADYAYFSAYSASWLEHARRYVADAVTRFGLDASSHVVEVAANDGYLLQYVRERAIPCLGIEPTHSTAEAARGRGIEIVEEFFGARLAGELSRQGRQADLMIANNVLAHVPDINDFVAGFAALLKPGGVATFEFPHVLRLVTEGQFDTIYHEHFSYLSLLAVERIFASQGLAVFDVEELPTHGGSLRVFAQRADAGRFAVEPRVAALRAREAEAGMAGLPFYASLQPRAEAAKLALLAFLVDARRHGKKVGAYGAAAKGNTLLNYAGVRPDLLPWVVDLNPAKQGKFLPGSRIPVAAVEQIARERPDFLLILPWNLKEEVMKQVAFVADWGCRFVTAIPSLELHYAGGRP